MSSAQQAIRVFIAAPIPSSANLVLSNVIESLGEKIPQGVRWVNPVGIHLTIKFLGNISPRAVINITEAMGRAAAEVSPLQVRLWGLGVFPNEQKPRVLWAGVDGDIERLRELQEKSESALEALGIPLDRRAFNPHLTLGRVRDNVNEQTRRSIGTILSSEELGLSEPWPVESMELIQTHFGSGGATYTTLASAPLRGVPFRG